MFRPFTCLLALFALASGALAQEKPLEPTKLKVRPAAAPTPALRYELLPELKDMTPGNGAIQYLRSQAPEWFNHARQPGWDPDKFYEYQTTPLKDLPRDKLQWLLTYKPLKELDIASRKESCEWDLTDRVRKDGIMLLLPDMQKFREMGALLAVRARLQIAEGHYEDALYTLQTGLMLGKRIGEAPTLICHLIGLAISNVMLAQLEELLQSPDAPNFYWALTYLPHPLIDMRKSLESERIWMVNLLPQLPELEASLKAKEIAPLNADQQETLVVSLADWLGAPVYGDRQSADREQRRLVLTGVCLKVYPDAKKALIAQGHAAKEIDALPVIQVVALRSVQVLLQLQDDVYKWFGLPYAERREGLERAVQQIRAAKARLDVVPLFDILPAVEKVSFAQARLDRRIAALRCIEAVRIYAVAHDGKPPASLDLVKDVPIPLDPVTGKAFEYKVAGDKVTLYGPPPGKEPPYAGNIVSYEVTLVR